MSQSPSKTSYSQISNRSSARKMCFGWNSSGPQSKLFSAPAKGAPFRGAASFLAPDSSQTAASHPISPIAARIAYTSSNCSISDFNLMDEWEARYSPPEKSKGQNTARKKARSESPARLHSTQRSKRMTILPDRVLNAPSSTPAEMERSRSATHLVGPWKKTTRRIPRHLLGGPQRRFPGEDSSESSSSGYY